METINRILWPNRTGGKVTSSELYALRMYALLERELTTGDVETLMKKKYGIKLSGNQIGKILQHMRSKGLIVSYVVRQTTVWRRAT